MLRRRTDLARQCTTFAHIFPQSQQLFRRAR
jgi:hypothetical protein